MRREWIEIATAARETVTDYSLPPCGGSGLKFRSELRGVITNVVSLHAEGVD